MPAAATAPRRASRRSQPTPRRVARRRGHGTPLLGPVRLEPRHRRGHRAPDRARTVPTAAIAVDASATLDAQPATCRRTAPWWSSPRRTTARRPTTPPRSATGSADRQPAGAAPGVALHRLRLRQPELGGHLPGRARADRRAARAHGGATRIHPRGEGDARGDFDGQFRAWYGGLWAALGAALGLDDRGRRRRPRRAAAAASTSMNRRPPNPVVVSYRACRLPSSPTASCTAAGGPDGERSTRHVELALPDGVRYSAGDHLGVLPRNGVDLIRRVIARFGLDAGSLRHVTRRAGPRRTCRWTSRTRCSASSPAASSSRTPPTRGQSRRWPARRRPAPSGRSWRPWPATTRTAERATATRCSAAAAPCSTCWRSSRLRAAVRGLPRPAAAPATAVLLDLSSPLATAGAQHHRGGVRRPGARRRGPVRGVALELPGRPRPGRRRSSRFVRDPRSRSARRPTRTRR